MKSQKVDDKFLDDKFLDEKFFAEVPPQLFYLSRGSGGFFLFVWGGTTSTSTFLFVWRRGNILFHAPAPAGNILFYLFWASAGQSASRKWKKLKVSFWMISFWMISFWKLSWHLPTYLFYLCHARPRPGHHLQASGKYSPEPPRSSSSLLEPPRASSSLLEPPPEPPEPRNPGCKRRPESCTLSLFCETPCRWCASP